MKTKTKQQDLFVAALQTTYLLKVLQLFKPGQIRKIRAFASKQSAKDVEEDQSIGLTISQSSNNSIRLEYDDENHPVLEQADVDRIKEWLLKSRISDMNVEYLEVEIPVDFDAFEKISDTSAPGTKLTGNYILKFENSECPESEPIRKNIAMVNNNIYKADSNQFRYRQLVLTFLMKSHFVGTVKKSQYGNVALIDLGEDWKHDTTLKFGSNNIGIENTVVGVRNALGNWCIQERFKLTGGKKWEFAGLKK